MTRGILLMAYGSPNSPEEVEPYLRDIRGGRPIRVGLVEELSERYRTVGMPSPLLGTTRRQAAGLEAVLGDGFRVFVGMKHWTPRIHDAVKEIAADEGITHVTGIALAPHFSQISIGGYEDRVRAAQRDLDASFTFDMVHQWFDEPAFIDLVSANLRTQLAGFEDACVFFTAHSLPARILAEGDPYQDQLLGSAKLIADAAGALKWEFAFQSASVTGEPWLGPDIAESLRGFAAGGGKRAVIAPIGFVADHLEILYDVDIECAAEAARLGLELRRIASPNDDARLIEALASVVRARVTA